MSEEDEKSCRGRGRRDDQDDQDELLNKLEIIGDGGWFLCKIFFLCTIPSILNGVHLTSYVYLAEVPDHWCEPPYLRDANWTNEEIRLVSSPTGSNKSSCEYYNWDYKMLSEMSFQEALANVTTENKPELLPCSRYHYAEGSNSIVINYDLVCDRTPLKSMIQVSLSFGKFLGALIFGLLSDKYGRKFSFLLSGILYIVSGPLVAFALDYSMIVAGRIGLGAASLGIYNSAYIILSEIVSKRRRSVLGILYNMSYPLGQMIIPLLAYLFRDWRILQTVISVPSLLILVFYWFLPESPRWLILNGRREEAGRIIEKAYASSSRAKEQAQNGEHLEMEGTPGKGKVNSPIREESKREKNDMSSEEVKENEEPKVVVWKKISATLNQILVLFKHFELRGRLFVSWVAWCICSMCYYVLALNVDNFLADRYLYGFVSGLVETPSYVLPLPLLKYFGRRPASIILFYIGGFALLVILAVPRHEANILLVIASIGRLCASAAFAVVILHTTELFPTLLRNTAIGCCSTAAHIGSMSAPLIVDILGAYAWFIPSTVCGVVTILAGTIIFILPETKNKTLPDTVEDIINAPESEKIGFRQICPKRNLSDGTCK